MSAFVIAVFYATATALSATNSYIPNVTSGIEHVGSVRLAHQPALIASSATTAVSKQTLFASELPVKPAVSYDLSATDAKSAGVCSGYHTPLIHSSLFKRAPPER